MSHYHWRAKGEPITLVHVPGVPFVLRVTNEAGGRVLVRYGGITSTECNLEPGSSIIYGPYQTITIVPQTQETSNGTFEVLAGPGELAAWQAAGGKFTVAPTPPKKRAGSKR